MDGCRRRDSVRRRQTLLTPRCGVEHRWLASLMSWRQAVRFGPPQPIRAGWALVSPTLCKSAVHSEVVRIHPCPPVSGVGNQVSEMVLGALIRESRRPFPDGIIAAAAQWQSGSLPTSRRGVRFFPAAPIRTGSSAVERRVEGARVGGSIPSLCTIFRYQQSGISNQDGAQGSDP
jgi:hypothetical protein